MKTSKCLYHSLLCEFLPDLSKWSTGQLWKEAWYNKHSALWQWHWWRGGGVPCRGRGNQMNVQPGAWYRRQLGSEGKVTIMWKPFLEMNAEHRCRWLAHSLRGVTSPSLLHTHTPPHLHQWLQYSDLHLTREGSSHGIKERTKHLLCPLVGHGSGEEVTCRNRTDVSLGYRRTCAVEAFESQLFHLDTANIELHLLWDSGKAKWRTVITWEVQQISLYGCFCLPKYSPQLNINFLSLAVLKVRDLQSFIIYMMV